MFKRIGEVAEQVANGVSRRAFLGKLGQGALVAAGVLTGFLALPGEAQAARNCRVNCREGSFPICLWSCAGAQVITSCSGGKCPSPGQHCKFLTATCG